MLEKIYLCWAKYLFKTKNRKTETMDRKEIVVFESERERKENIAKYTA